MNKNKLYECDYFIVDILLKYLNHDRWFEDHIKFNNIALI